MHVLKNQIFYDQKIANIIGYSVTNLGLTQFHEASNNGYSD